MNPILQSEAVECGLASLAMVADAHGMSIGLAELRRRFPMSLKGAKLSHLIHIAQQLGFQTRPLRLDMEDLGKVAGITCPAKVLFADPAQPYLPDPVRRARAALLPAGELVVLPGGHHLHMEQPREVAAAIGGFLRAD